MTLHWRQETRWLIQLRIVPSVLGRIQEFDPDIESVTTYLEKLYFVANRVEDDRQVPTLLTLTQVTLSRHPGHQEHRLLKKGPAKSILNVLPGLGYIYQAV